MVKVQKPTPKTFAKTGGGNNKKMDKTQKPSKKSAIGASVGGVAAVPETKTAKSKLIEKIITKEKLVVEPLKKEQKPKKNVENQPGETQPAKPTKVNKKNKKQVEAPAPVPATAQESSKKAKQLPKRPLILAPPESPKLIAEAPAAAAATAGSKKTKQPKVAKNDAPIIAVATAAKKSKKQKKSKASTTTDAAAAKVAAAAAGPKQKQPPLTKMQKKKATKRAFKKQQVKNKHSGKEAKQRAPAAHTFEPVPFDEDTFHAIVNATNVKKIAKALKKQVESEVAEKKTSIFSDFHYSLNVCCFKIPSCPKRVVKLNLKHSLVGEGDDVVVIVADLLRGAKVDYEPTIQHYEDLFREAGVEGLKIMPFNQLRTECNTFEAVRKFGNTYDYFICDGRLVGQVAGFCGKIFQKPRTTLHSVRMENTKNIKSEVDKSLRRTAFKQLGKGDLISIPVGNHNYTMQQLAENVEHVVAQLKIIYPGGLGNVRSMHLKIDIIGTSALPIYISTAQVAPETPYVVGPREKRMLLLKKDANEVLSNFNLTKDGQLTKLNKTQVERKRKFKEARETLSAITGEDKVVEAEEAVADVVVAEKAVAKEAVAEEAVVEVPPPSKKARKEAKQAAKGKKNKKPKKRDNETNAEESD